MKECGVSRDIYDMRYLMNCSRFLDLPMMCSAWKRTIEIERKTDGARYKKPATVIAQKNAIMLCYDVGGTIIVCDLFNVNVNMKLLLQANAFTTHLPVNLTFKWDRYTRTSKAHETDNSVHVKWSRWTFPTTIGVEILH